ncbi:MAG: hypothetical protein EPO40_16595 [Myxococcaceae bacterium]|nr:MAG: hypothetical protein EPO40_16595 [Myxococcaceae bacterium]
MTPLTPAALAAIKRRAAEYAAASDALARVIDDDRIAATGEHDAAYARRDEAAQASAADVPALLRHLAALTAQHAADVAAERKRAVAMCRARAEKRRKEAVDETAAAEYGEAQESRVLAREADALADAIAALPPTTGGGL